MEIITGLIFAAIAAYVFKDKILAFINKNK